MLLPIEKGQLAISRKLALVEAAGIEPASRDASTSASTCVVELFTLPRRKLFHSPRRCPTGSADRYLESGFNPVRLEKDIGRSRIVTDIRATLAIPLSPGCLFLGCQC